MNQKTMLLIVAALVVAGAGYWFYTEAQKKKAGTAPVIPSPSGTIPAGDATAQIINSSVDALDKIGRMFGL